MNLNCSIFKKSKQLMYLKIDWSDNAQDREQLILVKIELFREDINISQTLQQLH